MPEDDDPGASPGTFMINDLPIAQEAANQPGGATLNAALFGASDQMTLASGAPCQSIGLDDQGQPLGTLVPTNQLPSGAGFLSAANPCIAPAPTFAEGLPVYSVPAYSNLFLVWDVGYEYPTNTQPDNPEPQPPGPQYPDESLWLAITSIGSENVSVLLTNTVAGQPYTLLSQTTLPSTFDPTLALFPAANWMVEQHITGATGTATTVQVPVLGRSSQLFFWACSNWIDGPQNLWLEPLGMTNGGSALAIVLHGASVDGQPYSVLLNIA